MYIKVFYLSIIIASITKWYLRKNVLRIIIVYS